MKNLENESVKRRNIQSIRKGDIASLQRTISEYDILRMAEISGDYNPIHLDDEYAKTTSFKKVIAHGLFCAAMISALLGNELPGLGTILVSENIQYLRPVFVGDTITASVLVDDIDYETRKITLSFLCENQKKYPVVKGTAETLLCEENS